MVRAIAGRDGGAALMALHYAAALEAYARTRRQAGRVLYQRRGTQPAGELRRRSHRHDGAGGGGRRYLFAWRFNERPGGGSGTVAGRSLVWGIGLSLGGTTGYAINPARDLGPRLIHALLPIPGKGGSNWRYAWIPIVGDLTGGALAGLLLHYAHL